MIVLIDGDILVFKLAFRHQHKFEFGAVTDARDVVYDDMRSFIQSIQERTLADDVKVCLTSFNNFRKELKKSYKIHRKKQEKPKLLATLRKFLIDSYDTLIWDRLEADDIMGILSTRHPGEYIIASTDKDLLQIPGKHYNWTKDIVWDIDNYTADKFFYSQVLTGDRADGYTGIRGIGPKKAEKLLKGVPVAKMWDVVVNAYEKAGMTAEDALMTARMAFILREGYYQDGEIKFWIPPIKEGEYDNY